MTPPSREEVRRRYLMDPEFHAAVEMVVHAFQQEHDERLDLSDRSLVAAAVAFVFALHGEAWRS